MFPGSVSEGIALVFQDVLELVIAKPTPETILS